MCHVQPSLGSDKVIIVVKNYDLLLLYTCAHQICGVIGGTGVILLVALFCVLVIHYFYQGYIKLYLHGSYIISWGEER